MNKFSSATINASYIYDRFPTEESALRYLDEARWGEKPGCPHCGSDSVSKWHYKEMHRCLNGSCNAFFNARHDTIFEGSKTPLRKWFLAAYHMMHEDIGVDRLAYRTGIGRTAARNIFYRICEAMGSGRESAMLKGTVEIDEAVFGGIERYKHCIRGASNAKHGVLCMVEQGKRGRSVTVAVPGALVLNAEGKYVTKPDFSKKALSEIIRRYVDPGAAINTDDYPAYRDLEKDGLAHTHSDKGHTSAVEGRLLALKNILRNYRDSSGKYLQRYIDVADFRYNETGVFEDKDGTLVLISREPTVESFEAFIKGCFRKISKDAAESEPPF